MTSLLEYEKNRRKFVTTITCLLDPNFKKELSGENTYFVCDMPKIKECRKCKHR